MGRAGPDLWEVYCGRASKFSGLLAPLYKSIIRSGDLKKALSQSPVRCFSLARANQEKWACLISQNDFLRTVNLDTGWMRVNSCLTADHDALTGFWEVNAE